MGNTALHYASMSRRAEFVEEVLKMYRHPSSFLHFKVEFKRPEDLDGLSFQEGGPHSAAEYVVSRTSARKHGQAGIMFGDGLESVSFKLPVDLLRAPLMRAQPDPKVKDVVRALANGQTLKSFPVEFKFCRPALVGIFAQDTWSNIELNATESRQHPDDLKENLKILRLLAKERAILHQETGRLRHPSGKPSSILCPSERPRPPVLPILPQSLQKSSSSPRISKRLPEVENPLATVTNRGFHKSNSVPIVGWSNKAVDRANWSLPR